MTKSMVRERLLAYEKGDNRITELSRAYRIELGTGWYTPPGVVHAPGSVLTSKPQWNSDVNSVQENVTLGEIYPCEFLAENAPEDRKADIDYVMDLMDWEKNVDPHYRSRYFRPPLQATGGEGSFAERWIVYDNPSLSAKELTVPPRGSVMVKDAAAYGCILVQGHGRFGGWDAEAAGDTEVRPAFRRRVLPERTGSTGGSTDYEREPLGTHGDPEAFRSEQCRSPERGGRVKEDPTRARQGSAGMREHDRDAYSGGVV